MSKTSIVIGLGHGDEGKGLTTAYLAKYQKKPLVIRFSGGQQAGHTVVDENGLRHVFSNFGSGSLSGAPTYWSKYCTIEPYGILQEYISLTGDNIQPILYVDNLSMITTPYDVAYNRTLESLNKHGSCGMGFAATIERAEKKIYSLYAQDLLLPKMILRGKLRNIKQYYNQKLLVLKKLRKKDVQKIFKTHLGNHEDEVYIEHLLRIKEIISLTDESIVHNYDSCIFEGSQGILLDKDYGFFPHVTRSNTISKNAMEIIRRQGLSNPDVYYITRAYQSRHGNGPMTNQQYPLELENNEFETNVTNPWQGDLRTSILDIDLLNYALSCDANFTNTLSKHLVVTCLDQIKKFEATKDEKKIILHNVKDLIDQLNTSFDSYFESYSSKSHKLCCIM